MQDFHICHILPAGRVFFGLNAYRDIADSVLWGIQALGHRATYAQNSIRHGAVNIVMGAQMLVPEQLDEVPANSVIYNFEQLARVPLEKIRAVLHAVGRRFRVWDYCDANLERWQARSRSRGAPSRAPGISATSCGRRWPALTSVKAEGRRAF